MDRSFSLLFLCVLQITTSVVAKCYFPDGNAVSDDFPCDPDADDSPCCHGGLGSACLSNKLCRGPNGNTVRGSCSYESWDSPLCAHYCLSANTGGTDLISCSNVTGSDTSYCCDHAPNCCNGGVGRFDVLPAEPQVWATWNRESSRFLVILQTSSESSTSTTTPSSSTTTSDAATTASAGPAPTGAIPSTPLTTGGPASTAAPTQGEAEGDPGLSTTAKVGIGAGAGAGALLVAAIVYLLLKIRRNKKALQAQQAQQAQQEAHRWPGVYQEPPMGPVYYNNGPPESWAPPRATEVKTPPAFYGSYEMDARPAERHWARVELPTNP
ncbi:hypothetical protein CTA2_3135 [Colletotrichum tanaceti]|uniref:Mid2 domain-containing protein n=1 Tax=Colletotrichum tanaceti TaxID=1306861 RepID=A0A4U6XD56_9PEZI|nr:hypothetical protein CTA2_3135 [Colletotrichum tanaceti]TKW53691.1 hypothetical protein CTA1_4332 [Colletotrichum tanaceti]